MLARLIGNKRRPPAMTAPAPVPPPPDDAAPALTGDVLPPRRSTPLLDALRASKAVAIKRIAPAQAAASLLAWLQAEQYDGWLTIAEIDDAWLIHRDDLNCEYIPIELIREHLVARPGVKKIRARLKGDPQFGPVLRRLQAQGRIKRDGTSAEARAIVIYIPPDTPCAAAEPPVAPHGTGRTARPSERAASGPSAGPGPGGASKHGDKTQAAPRPASAASAPLRRAA